MDTSKKVVAFHLFNDFSGSPKILEMSLEALVNDGYDITLFTSTGGVLDNLSRFGAVHKHTVNYSFSSNPIVTIFRLLRSQTLSFFKALKHCRQHNAVTYINTILPFGAALGAKIAGSRVIYHYHENAFAKGTMYRLLASLMRHVADDIICVGDFQAAYLSFPNDRLHIIPNALPASLCKALRPDPADAFKRKRILMISSLKEYKGTIEFFILAKELSQFNWEIVINASESEIEEYLNKQGLKNESTKHISVIPRQTDISRFYNRASLVISLTNPDKAVETFGLTAAEAMTAGLPVIVPTVGGIADLVTDGYNGFKLDVRNLSAISSKIKEILNDENLYMKLSAGALEKAREFQPHIFSSSICRLFKSPFDN